MRAMARIHILGASGSGTTTLGVALADRLGVPYVDADTLFWLPTNPPFTTRRSAEARLALLQQKLPLTGQCICSGSATKWATPAEPHYDLIVLLQLDPAERMARLRQRETLRYGARIGTGGDLADASAAFLVWAASYDTAGLEQHSLAAHEAWLAAQSAAVQRLDADRPLQELITDVTARPA
jgi:adenylate kinase family enzyme